MTTARYGRADWPFEFQAVCIDKFDVDGHRELAEIGRHRQHRHPMGDGGLGFDAPLAAKQDAMKRYADKYIQSGWQEK